MKRLAPGLAVALLATACAPTALPPAAGPPPAERALSGEAAPWEHAARVDSLLADWDDPASPGCAVGVVDGGELVFARGYGSANLDYGIPLTPASVFYLASVSKQFTAAAVLLAEDDGYLSLDDDVRRWIPELPDYGSTVTVRHLVHHTGGLRDYLGLMSLAGLRYGDAFGDDDMLGLIARQRALNFEPGAEYLYSNTGYVLLAEIVNRATGRSLGEYAEERIFAPLGMTSSHFHDDARRIVPGRVISYGRGGDGFRVSYLSQFDRVGDGGMYSTVEDLARWVDALHRDRVGSPGFAARLEERGVLADGETLDYAFGQIVGDFRGARQVGHGGSMMDFRTMLQRFPDEDAAVVVLCNVGSANPGALAAQVAEVAMGDRLAPASEAPAESDAPPASVELSAADLEALVGRYQVEEQPGTIFTFEREGDRLFGGSAGGPRFPLIATSDTTFRVPGLDASVTFHRGADAEVRSVTLHQNGDLFAHRLGDDGPDGGFDPGAFSGRYHSLELDAVYTLEAGDRGLTVRLPRGEPIDLEHVRRDEFAGSFPVHRLVFEREEAGGVIGFTLDAGRVRGIRFERVDVDR